MQKEAKRQVRIVSDYRRVFSTDQGKRVLYDIMKSGHVLGPTFVKGDVNESLLREGERNMVLRILAILKTDPNKLEDMIREREEENARQ